MIPVRKKEFLPDRDFPINQYRDTFIAFSPIHQDEYFDLPPGLLRQPQTDRQNPSIIQDQKRPFGQIRRDIPEGIE
jgi:hypothetical protein